MDRPRPVVLADFFDLALTTVITVDRRAARVSLRIDATEHDIPA